MINFLFNLKRWQKRALIMLLDTLLIPLAIWASFAMRHSTWTPNFNDGYWLLLIAPILTIPLFTRLGLYRAVIRFISGQQAVMAVLKGITLSVLILALIALLARWEGIPRSVYLIYWGTAFFFIGGSRYLIRLLYIHQSRKVQRTHTLIYGAGESGIALATSLSRHSKYRPVAYIDDNPTLQKSIIQGLEVYNPLKLPEVMQKLRVGQVLLAMPAISKARKSDILKSLEPYPVRVLTVPSVEKIITGERRLDELREIEIDELLGRDLVTPDQELLKICIQDRQVMVTGAGGSIGSELCRQIIQLKPKALVLLDASEYALYQIEKELNNIKQTDSAAYPSDIIPVLGSVQDQDRLSEVLQYHQIETLYHAAAYKHVPLVEHNPIEGIINNTFGTLRTALAARAAEVRHFVLISTDKAVRPTNVMGASKRMAELVLQGMAQKPGKTLFSMVRFGNVLGSSGSVVPLFRQQIRYGGPITVTHPEMTRYFMTIPEAAQLVIQAGAMARGGEVFLLDMGKPVKIYGLAQQMIHLSGLSTKTPEHTDGDIEIKITGLRPGEKLYEELLIDSQADKTGHPRIYRAQEACLSWPELTSRLDRLETACEERDIETIQHLLDTSVQGFKGFVKAASILPPVLTASSAAGNVSFLPKRI